MLRPFIRNQLLLRLTEEDAKSLVLHLRPVNLRLKQELITPGLPISHIYFPESGIVSVITATEGSEAIETGLIGREGVTDQVLENGDSSVLRCIVQLEGSALAIEASQYVEWISEHPAALKLLARYLQYTAIQLSFTALSHGSFNVEETMCFDRSDGEDLPLVHQFISMMLGVRRSGVSTALHVIESQGAIRATRGRIQLRDRAKLEELTAGSYGVPEREYQRLLGPLPN
jgi:CRP-like cAMP-binding protein